MFFFYYQLSNNKNRSKRIECVNSKKRYFKMSLDKSRLPKLSDSSRKFIPNKRRKSMNDLFVERTAWTRTKKGKKVSGGVVETRRQKASEEAKQLLEVEIHPIPALDENRAGHGTEGNGNRRMTSESTHIELGHIFAIPPGL